MDNTVGTLQTNVLSEKFSGIFVERQFNFGKNLKKIIAQRSSFSVGHNCADAELCQKYLFTQDFVSIGIKKGRIHKLQKFSMIKLNILNG